MRELTAGRWALLVLVALLVIGLLAYARGATGGVLGRSAGPPSGTVVLAADGH